MHYLKGEAEQKIPVWRMISAPVDALKDRAARWQETLGVGEVITGESTVGGGSLPEETLPTYLLALPVRSPNRFLTNLRRARPPVIARVENDQVVLDPRAVLPEDERDLLKAVASVLDTILK
jgi:L-seryl-tRNA(Ser) seleniumtransferase